MEDIMASHFEGEAADSERARRRLSGVEVGQLEVMFNGEVVDLIGNVGGYGDGEDLLKRGRNQVERWRSGTNYCSVTSTICRHNSQIFLLNHHNQSHIAQRHSFLLPHRHLSSHIPRLPSSSSVSTSPSLSSTHPQSHKSLHIVQISIENTATIAIIMNPPTAASNPAMSVASHSAVSAPLSRPQLCVLGILRQ